MQQPESPYVGTSDHFPIFSGSNYLSHGGCQTKFWLVAIVSRYLKNIGAMPQNKRRLSAWNKFLRRYVEF